MAKLEVPEGLLKGLIPRTALVLAALLFVAGGSLSFWFLGVQPLWDAWRSQDWKPVTAQVQELSVGPGPDGGNRSLKVVVSYRYQVDGRSYLGHRYGLHGWMDNREAQQAAYEDLLYRHRVQAWFNPEDPAESLLNRDLHWTIVAMALPALGALLMGIVILWAAGVGSLATWRAALRLRRAGVR